MSDKLKESPNMTVIERKGGGGAAILIGIILLVAVLIGAFYLFDRSPNDPLRTKAISGATDKVGDSAKKASDEAAE